MSKERMCDPHVGWERELRPIAQVQDAMSKQPDVSDETAYALSDVVESIEARIFRTPADTIEGVAVQMRVLAGMWDRWRDQEEIVVKQSRELIMRLAPALTAMAQRARVEHEVSASQQ